MSKGDRLGRIVGKIREVQDAREAEHQAAIDAAKQEAARIADLRAEFERRIDGCAKILDAINAQLGQVGYKITISHESSATGSGWLTAIVAEFARKDLKADPVRGDRVKYVTSCRLVLTRDGRVNFTRSHNGFMVRQDQREVNNLGPIDEAFAAHFEEWLLDLAEDGAAVEASSG
ncbi:hypothetical protein [Alteraurantiacibacter palmitatis]|uniref:Uncharacterized protein n=1 Tax=Alteraurantiacibacter palmitatis TaxID=2054628 RepID=A0ABV7E5X4_9SPHN